MLGKLPCKRGSRSILSYTTNLYLLRGVLDDYTEIQHSNFTREGVISSWGSVKKKF